MQDTEIQYSEVRYEKNRNADDFSGNVPADRM